MVISDVLRVFRSFLGSEGILVILVVFGVFWSFYRFRVYFGCLRDFGGVLVFKEV